MFGRPIGRHRALAAAATVVALGVTATGCGVGDGTAGKDGSGPVVASDAPLKGAITFQTWSLKNPTFTPYFTSLISSFEREHPGTHVNWVDQPGDGYADKVVSQVVGHSLPDVVNLPPDIAYSVAKTGGLLDLGRNDPRITSEYVASALKAYTYPRLKGTYGFPWYLGADMNYWNKAMFLKDGLDPEHPPTTLDELIAQAKTMHDRSGGKDYLMSSAPGLGDIVNTGTALMNADGTKFVFNTPAAAAMLDKYRAAYQAGYLPADVLNKNYEGNNALFLKQVVAWTTGQGNGIQTVAQTNPSLAKQMIPSPSIGTPKLNVQGVSVSAKSKNLPLALAFARYVTDNANQAAFITYAPGFVPGTAEAAKDPKYSGGNGGPEAKAAAIDYQDMRKAVDFTPPVWSTAMDTYLAQQIAQAVTGKETSRQALDNAVARANQLLAD
ncbi:extracellular solute-binding protein [Streptantibioticus cattleyicolor]|uniref:Extracellular solute-binding protein family 1 n=1 Tax=Streptantibioticus cattleyicolor (strain ATCC 35852 / DSM 46488 / JCM 4925 / NBRC 14057 / NRRL 8057) TaxID=1003195 RepID=F8JIZ9_STREN|nr:extracellular solute-binding protein [Streptantibioticus cattleyicolor]AEW98912.1 extracellular solute-binding protein family 1 [Streptantibioticus cattleyicolor NRRL 8057 = DSM 46488]CCB72041.1 Carbohydrate ABC transporter substrate-binding protein, CUT1 family [Streptantibioticus cattleyicolor NRRL 8057 = DSM 46488]